jgi:signal transduction histidine kinase
MLVPVNGRGRSIRWTAGGPACQHPDPAMSLAPSAGTSTLRLQLQRSRGWLAYALAWVAVALMWTLAATMSSRVAPALAMQFGLVIMGTAGVLGVGVWWLTGRLPWDRRSFAFYAVHACAAVLYAISFTLASLLLDLFKGYFTTALGAVWNSPVLGWNILMGSWLYLIVAGLSYGIRTQQKLNQQAAAEAEARMLAERAQLAALRARLNPHFLFNALHTVSSLVSTDPAAADEAIERLGGLLRYALDESTEEIPLEREWAFTRDYLSFERLRLGERLRVREAFDRDALASHVPLLVLQPLVENAVRHAIAPSPVGGTIHVSASLRDHALTLRVEDDGPGGDERGVDSSRGLGLRALKRRLDVRYGARAHVDIRTAPGEGFSVTVVLPALSPAATGAA